jgi:hypothetical protein
VHWRGLAYIVLARADLFNLPYGNEHIGGGAQALEGHNQEGRSRKGAARIFWDSLTPEERSAEMKRRAKVRKRNKAGKAKSK